MERERIIAEKEIRHVITQIPNPKYLTISSFPPSKVTIEQLASDFYDSLGISTSTGPLSPTNNEAPILFIRNGYYYLLYGHTCCFCPQGADSVVLTSTSMSGPWSSDTYDINPENGLHKMVCGSGRGSWYSSNVVAFGRRDCDSFVHPNGDVQKDSAGFFPFFSHLSFSFSQTISAQENYVVTVQSSLTNFTYLYTGDMWHSAPDDLKSHDFQYWQPLTFDDTVTPPRIKKLEWMDSFTLEIYTP
jgi:hypothetical protein